jgi:hypothetical protein
MPWWPLTLLGLLMAGAVTGGVYLLLRLVMKG